LGKDHQVLPDAVIQRNAPRSRANRDSPGLVIEAIMSSEATSSALDAGSPVRL